MRQSEIRFRIMQIKACLSEARLVYDESNLPDSEEHDRIGITLDAALEACDEAMGRTISPTAKTAKRG